MHMDRRRSERRLLLRPGKGFAHLLLPGCKLPVFAEERRQRENMVLRTGTRAVLHGRPVPTHHPFPRQPEREDISLGQRDLHRIQRLQQNVSRIRRARRGRSQSAQRTDRTPPLDRKSRHARFRPPYPAIRRQRTVGRNRIGNLYLQPPHATGAAVAEFALRPLFAFRQCRLLFLQGPRGRPLDRDLLRRDQLPPPTRPRLQKVLPHGCAPQSQGPPRAGNMSRQRRIALDRNRGRRTLPFRPGKPRVPIHRTEP